MRFDLTIQMTPESYRFRSIAAHLDETEVPLCVTTMIKGQECFMAIGEPEDNFIHDPDYLKAKENGELRWLNPFDSDNFEPRNAFLVVYAYMRRAHRGIRANTNASLRLLLQVFWDKCHLDLDIANYDSVSEDKRTEFEKQLGSVPTFREITINNRTIASTVLGTRCAASKSGEA